MSHYRVLGRVDGAPSATITIDRLRGLISVRPKGRHREYTLPAAFVAEMIVAKVVKQEMR